MGMRGVPALIRRLDCAARAWSLRLEMIISRATSGRAFRGDPSVLWHDKRARAALGSLR